MRLSLAAAALLFASGTAVAPIAAMAQATTTPSTTGTPTAGAQTPAASVNTSPQTTTSPSPSSVQTRNTTSRTAAAPVAGRNSFTLSQATRRITAAGFTNVAGLKKDGQGVWRGQAQKDGSPVSVSLDYQGNVTGQ